MLKTKIIIDRITTIFKVVFYTNFKVLAFHFNINYNINKGFNSLRYLKLNILN